MKPVTRGVVGIIGFLLSPLSPWNDIFINIPLSYIIATPAAIISKEAFFGAFILAYWLTNIIGLLLMHKAITNKALSKKDIQWNLLIAIGYTVLLVILILSGILPSPAALIEMITPILK